jgi:hypothetical protein
MHEFLAGSAVKFCNSSFDQEYQGTHNSVSWRNIPQRACCLSESESLKQSIVLENLRAEWDFSKATTISV